MGLKGLWGGFGVSSLLITVIFTARIFLLDFKKANKEILERLERDKKKAGALLDKDDDKNDDKDDDKDDEKAVK